MKINKVEIKNFRLLREVSMSFESKTTLIVGRNNSGKTSLTEVIRRFLDQSNPKFTLADFSADVYKHFIEAYQIFLSSPESLEEIREVLPTITMRIFIKYDSTENLGPLVDFIINLNPQNTTVVIEFNYRINDGDIPNLFNKMQSDSTKTLPNKDILNLVKRNISNCYICEVLTIDEEDDSNRKNVTTEQTKQLIKTGFINAQRGLDDVTTRESDVLARIVEGLFKTAMNPNASKEDKSIVEQLNFAVEGIQESMNTQFSERLNDLIPTLNQFGYPGLHGPDIKTETILDVEKLLTNNTKIQYEGGEGVTLPESYNGLGFRNLLYILLKLLSYKKSHQSDNMHKKIHLIFIEEPEAHLHPQMQEVFIKHLSSIAKRIGEYDNNDYEWPVQFVVSTHSSHVSNAARFNSIRYFTKQSQSASKQFVANIKDLRSDLKFNDKGSEKFLHKYLTLTKCDLFFADKAILVEGLSERLLLPKMMQKFDGIPEDIDISEVHHEDTTKNNADKESLSTELNSNENDEHNDESIAVRKLPLTSQYITIMEVGGAYAHIFIPLLKFLSLPTLIITDIDSVGADDKICQVSKGVRSSNHCINKWFTKTENPDVLTIADLLSKTKNEMQQDMVRISYQVPQDAAGHCGRSFEDAFMLANLELFDISPSENESIEDMAFRFAQSKVKADFALRYAIDTLNWNVPKYIWDGLSWLHSYPHTDREVQESEQ